MSTTSLPPTTVHELVPLFFVNDIEASVAFYVEKLDFRQSQSWDQNGRLGWCRLDRDGAAIMLQQTSAEDRFAGPRGDGVTFYFQCDDSEDVYQRLVARGVAVDPPELAFYGMKQVFAVDPDGYRLCFQNQVSGE